MTLKPVGPKEDANQVGNHDTTYLPSGQLVDLPGGQTFDTYAAPSESAHAESRDKIITNADKVYVVGTVGDWVLMWCNSEDHNPYYGYVRRSDIQGDLPATYNLQFAGTSAVVLKKATVYEAPNKHTTELTSCDKNTELTYLATTENGNYAYVETRDSSGKAVRGFVPRGSLIVNFRKANPFKVDAKCTQVKPSNNANGYITYYPDNMFDGKQSTCWQFRIKKTKLTDVSATITFSSPTALSVMEVRNGFQKNESTGGDQYPKNSRLQKVKISFKYQGGSKFTDAMEVTLPDTKNWQSLNWGSMVDISNDGLPRENVIAVKIQPQSIYEGNKWPEDVAVAEMTFYQDR